MKRSLDILLVLRFSTSNTVRLVSAIERCLDALERGIEEPLPVHWAFAPHWLVGDSSRRADEVLARLKARSGDMIVPAGFAGAYHLLLAPSELERELAWAVRNPWLEGVEDCFGRPPDALVSDYADLFRTSSEKIYAASPVHLVVAQDGGSVSLFDGKIRATIPSISVCGVRVSEVMKRLKRAYRREEHDRYFVVVDPLRGAPGELEELLAQLVHLSAVRAGLRFETVRTLLQGGTGQPAETNCAIGATSWIPVDPQTRLVRRPAFGRTDTKRSTPETRTRRRLELLSAMDTAEAGIPLETEAAAPVTRTLIADMSGDITLSEGSVDVHFRGGEFAGLSRGGTQLLSGGASRGYFRSADSENAFRTVSTFSFEDEGVRGLRVIKGLSGEGVVSPGRVVLDFYFHEESDELIVSTQVLYPQFSGSGLIERYALIEMPLFEIGDGESISVEGEYPYGERYLRTIALLSYPIQLPGKRFLFRKGRAAFRIAFPTLEREEVELLPVELRSDGQRRCLYLNPRGNYAPVSSSAISGIQEHFTMILAADTTDRLTLGESLPAMSRGVEGEWMRRIGAAGAAEGMSTA